MKTGIKKAILATLHFYDMYDFPLTNLEIFDNLLHCDSRLEEVIQALNELRRDNLIGSNQGFYYLADRHKIVSIRKQRYLVSYHKWQVIKKYQFIFRLAPFVKMVGVANTLAYSNAKPDGDIDLLIVLKRKRMFLGRLILTSVCLLFDMWRWGNRVKNRFCLSFYLSEDNLDLSRLKLTHDDIYLAFWTKWLKPIYCDDLKIAQRYWRKNQWIKSYFPNTNFFNPVQLIDQKSRLKRLGEWVLSGWLGDKLENLLMKMQLAKIKNNTPKFSVDGIMADKDTLKFHPTGVRDKYYQEWKMRIKMLKD